MKDKKSFILYRDALCILDDLTDEQSGKLFKAIRAYHEKKEMELEPIIKMAFVPIRNQFARDAVKYAEMLEKRAIAGKKGGYQKQANLASASNCKQTVASLPDTVTDTDTVTDNDTIEEIISFLNDTAGKRFRADTGTTKSTISARLKDGYSLDDFKAVITVKSKEWKGDPKMDKNLRPQTLFIPNNFESYLNQVPKGSAVIPAGETNNEKRMRQAKANIKLYTEQGNPEAVAHFEKIVAECEEQINVK